VTDLTKLRAIVEATPPVNWNLIPAIVVRFWHMAPELIVVMEAAQALNDDAWFDIDQTLKSRSVDGALLIRLRDSLRALFAKFEKTPWGML
jgi:hypothetical protein